MQQRSGGWQTQNGIDKCGAGSFQLTTGRLVTICSYDGHPQRYLQSGFKVLIATP